MISMGIDLINHTVGLWENWWASIIKAPKFSACTIVPSFILEGHKLQLLYFFLPTPTKACIHLGFIFIFFLPFMLLDPRPLLCWLHWGAESRPYGIDLVQEYNDDQGEPNHTTWSSPKQWNLSCLSSCALHAGLQVAPNNTPSLPRKTSFSVPIRSPIFSPRGHSQCKTLSWSPRQLITYYLWYFADVAPYLLKKEVEKINKTPSLI